MSDTHELAWAAGFFDGEGSVRAKWNAKRGQRRTRAIHCIVGQKERAPLERFAAAVGVGRVHGPSFTQTKTGPMYRWEIAAVADVAHVRRVLSPWLCTRKQEQFDAAFVRHGDMKGCGSDY